jgi:Na+-transporting NADH:ubiquinone oxidoreductase subunit A
MITIRKGLDIRLKGEAEKIISDAPIPSTIAIKPTDFPGLVPKLLLKEGEKVKAGTPVFFDKYCDSIMYASPVSGTIASINRGAKRKIMEIVINADNEIEYQKNELKDVDTMNRNEVKQMMLKNGLWPFLRMRPIDIVADPKDTPKSIFISGFDSNPLSPDNDLIFHGKEAEFNAGLEVLKKLTDGPIHLQVRKTADDVFKKAESVQVNTVAGPHPAGNIGTQIHQIDTINKGDVVWYINPQDVLIVGRMALTGNYDASKIVALTGENVELRKYYKTILGSNLSSIVKENNIKANSRIISGNVLTGTTMTLDGHLGYYDAQITIIPEGNDYKFFVKDGWLSAGFNKLSASRAYPSWLMPKSKSYSIDTNLNGEERAFVVTGQYEKVFPFDIYPVHLVKSIITNDVEKMESLGIYEVAPEDFALCEFVCTSKINVQEIVREGLDLIYEECM